MSAQIFQFSDAKDNSENITLTKPTPTISFIRPLPIKIDHSVEFVPSVEETKHAAEPIKNPEDLNRVSNYLISTGDYRFNLLFVMGCNFGLRCGDLLRTRIGDILKSEHEFQSIVRVEEEKTDKFEEAIVTNENGDDVAKKIKTKKGNIRVCYMNDAVMDAATLYFNDLASKSNEVTDLNDYLFTSQSNNNSKAYYDTLLATGKNPRRSVNKPLTVQSVNKKLKHVINDVLGMDIQVSSHTMRKSFAYQILMNAEDRTRALERLQIILGHRSISSTLHYIGVTDDEIRETCQNLNLCTSQYSRTLAAVICYRDWETDRKSTRLNSSHSAKSRMPSSA